MLYRICFCFTLVLTFLHVCSFEMRNNRKGLLPEPNAVQIMKSLNNPAMLQILLQPQLRGCAGKPGKLLITEKANTPNLLPPYVRR